MKKIILYLFYAVMVVMTVACNSDNSNSYHIGVAQTSNDAWCQQMDAEMLREASFSKRKVELDIRSCHMNPQLQKAQI